MNDGLKQIIANTMQRGFVKMIRNKDDLRSFNSSLNIKTMMQEMKVYKQPRLMYPTEGRYWELDQPGERVRRHEIAAVRKRHRAQVSFLCKYVLASKNKKIPLK